MAEFKLGRIRFVWQGNWATTTNYVVDDVVSKGGKSCQAQRPYCNANRWFHDSPLYF